VRVWCCLLSRCALQVPPAKVVGLVARELRVSDALAAPLLAELRAEAAELRAEAAAGPAAAGSAADAAGAEGAGRVERAVGSEGAAGDSERGADLAAWRRRRRGWEGQG
jgi:hypothetical protein